jgi:hypothetical protein
MQLSPTTNHGTAARRSKYEDIHNDSYSIRAVWSKMPQMAFYLKGFLISLGSVALFYAALRFLMMGTKVGNAIMLPFVLVFLFFRDPNAPLGAVAGGSPNLLLHLWFWLWGHDTFCRHFLGLSVASHAISRLNVSCKASASQTRPTQDN